MLTTTFARPERRVVGVDPSAAMIAYAAKRPHAQAVQWVHGDSRDIPPGPYDYAVMTGNVAQHIDNSTWTRTLDDLRSALRGGGTLAFESRNPAVRAWESWSGGERTTRITPHGPLIEWMDAIEVGPGRIELSAHNLFVAANEKVTHTQTLAFRGRDQLESQLKAAGFDVTAAYGDWNRTPFIDDAPLMIFVAR